MAQRAVLETTVEANTVFRREMLSVTPTSEQMLYLHTTLYSLTHVTFHIQFSTFRRTVSEIDLVSQKLHF